MGGRKQRKVALRIGLRFRTMLVIEAPFGNHHISKCDIYILILGQNTSRTLFGNHISYISAYKSAMSHFQTSYFRV